MVVRGRTGDSATCEDGKVSILVDHGAGQYFVVVFDVQRRLRDVR